MEKSYYSKVAGFYRSSQRRCSVKEGVLRKVFAKCTGKHLCQRLYFNKVRGLRLWHKCLPLNFAKFLRTAFLQNTYGRLILILAFQKQPPEVFYEKRCSWKFAKFTEKHLWFAKFSRTPFLQNTSGRLLLAFPCNFTKMEHCQRCLENLRWIRFI